MCRSASYDAAAHTCSLSRFTRRTHPELLEDDPDCDYLENTCLNGTLSNAAILLNSVTSMSDYRCGLFW